MPDSDSFLQGQGHCERSKVTYRVNNSDSENIPHLGGGFEKNASSALSLTKCANRDKSHHVSIKLPHMREISLS